jgi:hypothetical protein
MRWLVHGSLTPAVAEALRRHGHQASTPEELSLAPEAPATEVLETAYAKQLDVLTNDHALVESPFEEPTKFSRTMVYFQLAGGDVEQDDAVDRLFKRYKRLSPGRVYTVTETRVKVRQLPGQH